VDEKQLWDVIEQLAGGDRDSTLVPLEEFGLPIVRDRYDFVGGVVREHLERHRQDTERLVELVRNGMQLVFGLPVFDQLARWEALFQEGNAAARGRHRRI
jgi:hypothetical protein